MSYSSAGRDSVLHSSTTSVDILHIAPFNLGD